MYIHITDYNDSTIYSTIPSELKEYLYKSEKENEQFLIATQKYRHGKIKTENGTVYAITNDHQITNRPRYFKERLVALTHLLPVIEQVQQRTAIKSNAHVKRLIHNLESLNGHSIQELYKLIPERELRETPSQERKGLIEQKVKEHQASLYKTIQNLIKNNASMKMEFSVFNKLMTGKVSKLEKHPHPLRKALLNVAHIFFQDFGQKNIELKVAECDEHVMVDYECFQVTFYQLFDNATKYVLKDTDIEITFTVNGKNIDVITSMVSLKIEDDEVDKIMQDGYCGQNAKRLGVNGKGIGMLNLKKTLELNKGHFEIKKNTDENTIYSSDIAYEKNVFVISLPLHRK